MVQLIGTGRRGNKSQTTERRKREREADDDGGSSRKAAKLTKKKAWRPTSGRHSILNLQLSLSLFHLPPSLPPSIGLSHYVFPANAEAGKYLSSCFVNLQCENSANSLQRAVAPIAATLLAGGIALYPRQTAFAEEPRDAVRARKLPTFSIRLVS